MNDDRITLECSEVWSQAGEASNTALQAALKWLIAHIRAWSTPSSGVGASTEDKSCVARWCSGLANSAKIARDNNNSKGTNIVWKGLVQIGTSAAYSEIMAVAMEPVQSYLVDSLRVALDTLLEAPAPSEFEKRLCWVRYLELLVLRGAD